MDPSAPKSPRNSSNTTSGTNSSTTRLLSGIASASTPKRPSTSLLSTPQQQRLYHPSVFRYSCRGKLSLDSRTGGRSGDSAGVCRGMQSQLDHIDQWRPMTKQDAVSIFQVKSSDYYGGIGDSEKEHHPTIGPIDPAGAAAGATTNGANGAGGAHAHALHAVYLSNVLVYPDSQQQDEDDNDDDDDKDEKGKKKDKMMVVEESTATPELEEWRCYGTTEVDLLVLRPENANNNSQQDTWSKETLINSSDQQKLQQHDDTDAEDEMIAAVAPYTAPGMQVRDVTTSTFGKERTRTIRLGFLEIVYSTVMDDLDDDDEENRLDIIRQNAQKEHDQQQNLQLGDGSKRNKSKTRKDDIEDGSSEPRLSRPAKVYKSAQNILKHMEINAKLLYESTQDSFPQRTYEAGQRIYGELDKTVNRTFAMMKKFVKILSDNDDNPSGSPKR